MAPPVQLFEVVPPYWTVEQPMSTLDLVHPPPTVNMSCLCKAPFPFVLSTKFWFGKDKGKLGRGMSKGAPAATCSLWIPIPRRSSSRGGSDSCSANATARDADR